MLLMWMFSHSDMIINDDTIIIIIFVVVVVLFHFSDNTHTHIIFFFIDDYNGQIIQKKISSVSLSTIRSSPFIDSTINWMQWKRDKKKKWWKENLISLENAKINCSEMEKMMRNKTNTSIHSKHEWMVCIWNDNLSSSIILYNSYNEESPECVKSQLSFIQCWCKNFTYVLSSKCFNFFLFLWKKSFWIS